MVLLHLEVRDADKHPTMQEDSSLPASTNQEELSNPNVNSALLRKPNISEQIKMKGQDLIKIIIASYIYFF